MILQAQLNRFTGTVVSLALGSAVIGGAMVLAPRGASAVEQQIVVTQTSPVFARGIMTRNYRITNPAGQPLQGVALFGSGGPLGNGGSPFCGAQPSDANGNTAYFTSPGRTCSFTTAFTGTYSPFTGPGPNSVAWPIALRADAPIQLTITPGTSANPVFATAFGDAVVTARTDIVTYGSPTNTSYGLRAEFFVQSSQADISLSVEVNPPGFDAEVDYQDASGAVVGAAHCVGLPCVNSPFAAPAGATKLVILLKAAGPFTITGGVVDWWGSSVRPVFSGPPQLPAATTTSTTTTSLPPTTVPSTTSTLPGAIDVSNQFFSGDVVRSGGNTYNAPLGLFYVVVPTAPNRTYADFLISCEGQPTVTVVNLSAIPGGNQACGAATVGIHTITVTDKLGQYPARTVRWVSAAGLMPVPAIAGRPVVLNAPGAATFVFLNGQPCFGATCTISGTNVVYNPGVDQLFNLTYQLGDAAGGTTYRLDVQPSTTTLPTSTVPPTTVPIGSIRIVAASTAVVGQPFTVVVSGATPGSGRIDLSIGGGSVGSQYVDATGSTTFTVAAWVLGSTTVLADWVTYVNGVAQSTKATVALLVASSGPATTAPPTTAPPTTAPPTTAPPTTAPPTTAPPTAGLKIAAPSSVRIGSTFTVRVTGANPPTGRVDIRIGSQTAGSFLVDGTGSITANVAAWTFATSITADWVRYENGLAISVSVTVPLVVSK